MKKILLLLFTLNTYAVEDIWQDLTSSGSRNIIERYPQIVEKLVSNGLYHTAVPYLKEYLVSSTNVDRARFDRVLEDVITKVGDRQFVLIPEKYLEKSTSPTIKYLLAKKYVKLQRYDDALKILNASIPSRHEVKPFALQLEAVAFSLKGSQQSAVSAFMRCEKESEAQLGSINDFQKKRQLIMNRDYCTVGIARALYASKEYEKAESKFLDLDKSSYVWPEILSDEAWNSFYKADYNRTLGKLVTYKAPVLNHIFNPEIEVLEALTYLKLCLYNDSINSVENYYKKYEKYMESLDKLLVKNTSDLNYFFLLVVNYTQGKKFSVTLLNDFLDYVIKDPTFLNLIESYNNGQKEIEIIKKIQNMRLKKVLATNLKDSLMLQKKIIGSYTKKSLKVALAQLRKGFIGMSYIKLEVLNLKKERLYTNYEPKELRGDFKYLKRNEKQYLWNFNGEFWADELGDYVFALKSECN